MKEFTYDGNGNQLTAETTDGTNFMMTENNYTENGNHVAIQIDARGKTVSRVINNSKDTLTSVTDPRGQTVNYTYDQNRKVTKTAATVDGKEYANSYTYTKDKLTQVQHNTSADASGDVAYNFEYDALGRPTVLKVGEQVLSATTYNADGTVQRVDYGNEDSVEYSYDEFKRTKGVRYGFDYEDRYVYEYGANGQVAQLTNTDLLTVTTSEHDAAGRPARITRKHLDTGAHLYTGEVAYDEFNNLKTFKEQVGSDRAAYTTTFTHDNENRPTLLNFGSSRQVAYVYDGLGRISRRTVNAGSTGVATTYGYLTGGHGTGSTTPLVQTITQSGTTLTYVYDDAGNITSVSDGTKTISYEYDLLGQLIRVNDPYDTTAGTSGTTWKYTYDLGGNIQSKTAYAFTTGTVGSAVKTDSFTYGDTNWKDKLTAFNGKTVTYDAIGNPTNDGTWNYTWIGGRQLRCMYKGSFGEQGYDEITFEYNEKGLRTKKTRMYYDDATGDIGYKVTNYTLHGKNIVHLSDGSNNLHFFYDAQNKPAVVIFNGTAYAYLYNLQGDVIGLVDSNGTKMVSYIYDAWGKMLSKTGTLASTLGTIQPFRYRGYVYDEESGLYYMGHRFYNANISRFISADANLNSGYVLFPNNQFCYCLNNPIMGADYDGFAASFGYFHALVQADFIATHPGVTAELGFYKYGDQTRPGRADLVNLATGDVWEIKPHMAGYNRNPVKYLNKAQKQLESYIEGEITNGKKREQLNGAHLHPGYAFPKRTIYDELTDMDITYWSEGDGIVWYEVSKRQHFEPVLVPAPEEAKSKSYSSYAKPSVSFDLGPVIAFILTAAALLLGMPTPGFAY